MRFDRLEPRARLQPLPGKSSTYLSAGGVLQTLCERRVARSVTVMLSALLLLLTTVGTCGAFPEFDSCCPERATHAQQAHASAGADHQGAHHDHPLAPLSHPDPGAVHDVDSPDDDGGYCECCEGFFLAHLSGLPAAIAVAISPKRSVDHSDPRRMALEFASAPPVPPPQPYLV